MRAAHLLASLAIMVAWCESPAATQLGLDPGAEYYTKVNVWHTGGTHLSINYRRGSMIPIGTQVEIKRVRNDEILLRLPETGLDLVITNWKVYSGETEMTLLERMLARQEIRLPKTGWIREAITNGKIKKGMTKEQVLMSRGYPPKSQTYSLESRVWKYWDQTWDAVLVVFDENGKVAAVFE